MAHNNLGIALFTEGKIKEAIDHYNKAIRITPDDAEPYYNRGTVYENQGKIIKLALDDFNEAIELRAGLCKCLYTTEELIYNKQGIINSQYNDYNKAIR